MILSIDMINLDHTYIAINSDEVFDSNKRCRNNIRPLINGKFVDISDRIDKQLITQHQNHTEYSYEAWLALYIKQYIDEVNEHIQMIIFTVPHIFNTKSIDTAMSIISKEYNYNIKYDYVYDYIAATTYMNNVNGVAIVPSEYETTIAYITDGNVNNVLTLGMGSQYIKHVIKEFIPFDISDDDAWTIYKTLQMLTSVDVSKIILSVETSFIVNRVDITNILSVYYNAIVNEIPVDYTIIPFRWIARDFSIKHTYENIYTQFNPDEAICLGAYRYVDHGMDIKCEDNCVYIDHSDHDGSDYVELFNRVRLTKKWNEFVNLVDEYLIETNQDIALELNNRCLLSLAIMLRSSVEWKNNNRDKYLKIINMIYELM